MSAAVRQALRLGAIGFDAVKHLVLCRIERRPPKLDLVAYPYLPRVTVATTQAKTYMAPAWWSGGVSDPPSSCWRTTSRR